MSIIQEALKKAGGQGDDGKPSEHQPEGAPAAPPQQPAESHRQEFSPAALRNIKTVLAVLAVILAAIVIKQMLAVKDISAASKRSAPSRQEVAYRPALPKDESGPEGSVVEKAVSSFPKPEHFGLKPAAPDLVLNGIMYLPDRPQAIINDSVVTEGDTIGGATVRKIERNRVVLDYDKLEITLNLKST